MSGCSCSWEGRSERPERSREMDAGVEVSGAEEQQAGRAEVVREGKKVTYDMKPSRDDPTAVGTQEMAEAVVERIRELAG